ncbi:HlyC/CorC family transporter [Ralstonia pseudosolanacearum]|uniref:Putative cbs (Cystathionine-beta-synthase) domain harboring transporter transmembrane protein n=2 Tax=Ralstonia solanacearum species complex TaxID=3116862 RepID=A0A0S4W9K0_RALSL|nr:HlyC/CorC family transporter [Ralstonia pseudosolanacearum]CUV43351.1 putative cbs (Cystathionine-beta-synthase) domain harboring transporter transmembrane protein [Ralstonia solanacearum]MDO3521065.1 HlyC/CorC family transporter [Ralstonia pseudosolanacearum]MDO3545632.1 HlyC/CorC family transporter [Ralstonia pseudosolanacearum]MDO3550373.1 HlyC/CorC family transporter [Ralstonia pseudosolanacearum]MDO3564779.1 HlyC/CorC family transporter [Ralstonia pseudosolanacearum]
MDSWPLWAQLGAVVLLLCCSAFFSISETSLMALNRHRLRHLAKSNVAGARRTQGLLGQTDKLLSLILIGNNLINTAVPVLIANLAIHYFGNSGTTLSIATAIVAFLIIVFCEIAPKIAGATYPERISFPASFIIAPLLRLATPLVTVVNAFVTVLLRLVRINPRQAPEQRMSAEELRTLVLESGNFIPHKHRSILLNLFDLDAITVDDVMTPRARVESLDLSRPIEEVIQQLETCYHNKLPVFEQDTDQVLGILHVRKALSLLGHAELIHDDFRSLLAKPYFVPSGTPVFRQLQYFQENRRRIGLVINEYGDMLGLVTLEDIIEEMIGEFTTTLPNAGKLAWDAQDAYLADAGMSLRDLNRRLGLQLPTDGPKTLNGLVLEVLEEIPEAPVSVRIAGCVMDIVQMDSQSIRTVRLHRPAAGHKRS